MDPFDDQLQKALLLGFHGQGDVSVYQSTLSGNTGILRITLNDGRKFSIFFDPTI